MPREHIVKSYEGELRHLGAIVSEMGGMAEQQLAHAIDALVRRDSDLAEEVVRADAAVDALERQVDQLVIKILALRQPVASDLRDVIAALRLSADIERVADYAKNVAKRTLTINALPQVKPAGAIPRMGAIVLRMLREVLDAYAARDATRARAVWETDAEVDELYNSLFRELLTYMMEDPRSISGCTHLLFIAKNIERIGDYATNMAELVHFAVHGDMITEPRPKGDATSTVSLRNPTGKAE